MPRLQGSHQKAGAHENLSGHPWVAGCLLFEQKAQGEPGDMHAAIKDEHTKDHTLRSRMRM